MAEADSRTYLVDKRLGDGLRYSERLEPDSVRHRRSCALWLDGVEKPVSEAGVLPFEARFGETAVPCEGFGGVYTDQRYHGRGYITILLTEALASMRQRVPAAFLFGIERLYPRFGFVPTLAEHSITVWTRRVTELPRMPGVHARWGREEDVAAVVDLYNRANAIRPWTHVRDRSLGERIRRHSAWFPDPRLLLLERDGLPIGYAYLTGRRYGLVDRTFRVLEATAPEPDVAAHLLAELGRCCVEEYLEEIVIEEARDTLVGQAAREIGATFTTTTTPDGGGMTAVLDRHQLVLRTRPELERRLRAAAERLAPAGVKGHDVTRAVDGVVAALSRSPGAGGTSSGAGIPVSDGTLARLLLGHAGWADQATGNDTPRGTERWILNSIFPGGGVPWLPEPHAHALDRY